MASANECYLGFEFSERCRAYLQPLAAANHQTLAASGWFLRLAPSDNWHATMVYFKDLPPSEREALWSEVLAAVARGAWKNLGFQWRGLALWPRSSVIVLQSDRYSALEHWGLEAWLDHPIFAKGDVKSLKRYTPHFTMMWLKEKPADNAARTHLEEEWRRIREELAPIDPDRIEVDRLTLFVRDSSKKPGGYIRGSTVGVG